MPALAAPPSPLVAVALSGGVDSAVAAGLLVEAGHRVVGMTMRLHEAGGAAAPAGRCCGPRDLEDARAVAAHLGIPYFVVDLEAEFAAAVIDDFVEAYLAGQTPNPCVRCNQHIKFTPLLARARALGADALATGHYARLAPGPDGSPALFRGVDPAKDQSYFLFSMPADALAAVRFPLGAMTKDEVRAHAARLGLPNAAKPESQEICFVPDGDHAGFVAARAVGRRPRPGPIVGPGGEVVGRHDGVHRYTVGQRRGLGNLAAPGGDPARLYVTGLDAEAAEVRVGPRAAAESGRLALRDLRWLAPPRPRLEAALQVRHRGRPLPAEIVVDGDRAEVTLRGERAVAAPGQAAVIYAGEQVVAGGWIA